MSSGVTQAWPALATYCRSSSQMKQRAGGEALSGYWVPHALQRYRGKAVSLSNARPSDHVACEVAAVEMRAARAAGNAELGTTLVTCGWQCERPLALAAFDTDSYECISEPGIAGDRT